MYENANFSYRFQTKPSFTEWDVKRAEEWLKSLKLYDQIPQEYVFRISSSYRVYDYSYTISLHIIPELGIVCFDLYSSNILPVNFTPTVFTN